MSHLQQILSLIVHYGYLIIFLGVMAESAGVPVPGETALIASGILVQQSRLDLWYVVLFGILGAVVGDQIGYWAGRRGGRPFVHRWGRYIKLTPERLARAERFFQRHGGKAVFLARFVTGLRTFGAITAGVSRMRWGTFILFNALGGAVWATIAVLIGYLLGGSLDLVERWAGRASALLVVMLVIAVAMYLVYRWISTHPERLKRALERVVGDRLQRFFECPAGLWLRRRFSPSGTYGLALTTGLVLTILFSWALGGIVQDVVSRDPLVKADMRILSFFYSHREPPLTKTVLIFHSVFSAEALLLAAAGAGCALVILAYFRGGFHRTFSGTVLLATAAGTGALAKLFGVLFDRPGPPASLRLVPEAGNSFPSIGAMAAISVGAAVWYLFSLRSPKSRGGSWRAKARIALAVVAFALLVGLGDMYIGTNYPSDVLAGWALGGVWASICLSSAEVFRRLRKNGEPLPETGVRYAQFSLVGASNALVDLGVLNLILFADPTRAPNVLVLYNAVALIAANVNSYLWNTVWTFRHHANHDAQQVGMFVLQAGLNVGVGSLVFWGLAHGLKSYADLQPQLGGNIAKVLSMVIASTASFVFLRYFVFNKHKRKT